MCDRPSQDKLAEHLRTGNVGEGLRERPHGGYLRRTCSCGQVWHLRARAEGLAVAAARRDRTQHHGLQAVGVGWDVNGFPDPPAPSDRTVWGLRSRHACLRPASAVSHPPAEQLLTARNDTEPIRAPALVAVAPVFRAAMPGTSIAVPHRPSCWLTTNTWMPVLSV